MSWIAVDCVSTGMSICTSGGGHFDRRPFHLRRRRRRRLVLLLYLIDDGRLQRRRDELDCPACKPCGECPGDKDVKSDNGEQNDCSSREELRVVYVCCHELMRRRCYIPR